MIAADLANVQVWVATTPVDMRKSFDGLAEVVRSFLGHDPLSGHLFVFRNKSGHLVKVLWWDRDGLAIYYKRLERALKRVAIGRKNWLFAGHDAAAENHARLWSLIASCERHGVDPQRYLTSVLAKLGQTPAGELGQFLPDVWKAEDAAEPVRPWPNDRTQSFTPTRTKPDCGWRNGHNWIPTPASARGKLCAGMTTKAILFLSGPATPCLSLAGSDTSTTTGLFSAI